MRVEDYLKNKMQFIGISASDNDLRAFLISSQINGEASVNYQNVKEMDIKFLNIILTLLLRPDVSEDDFSVKYDRKAVMTWYSAEAARLGAQDLIKQSSASVRDMSFLA